MFNLRAGACAVVMATLAISSTSVSAADPIADFYRSQTIRMIIGFPAGGVNDITARVLARLLPAQLPGAPRAIVQNMPGAGSMKAAEWLATQAPRDGTVIGAIATTAIMQSVLGPGSDPISTLEWVGSAESVTRVCYAYAPTGLTDLQTVTARGVILGATGANSPTSDHARLLKRALGERVRIVSGYAGSADLALALERGEIEAVCGTSIQSLKSERPDWYEQRRVNFLLRFAREARGEEANLPWYVDLLPETERSAAEYLLGQARFARAFASPPNIPPARLAALREAFAAAVEGAEFRTEMEMTGLDHAPTRGEEMARLIAAMRAADPALKLRAKQLVSDH